MSTTSVKLKDETAKDTKTRLRLSKQDSSLKAEVRKAK